MKDSHSSSYQKASINLTGGVAMGTSVMIGAGIFALTGQIAELAGSWFPLAFVVGAIVTGFSAYTYIKMSSAWPSSGGIAMILQKAYGPGAIAAAAALLMALSMVINESLVARTFATYLLRPFDLSGHAVLVPVCAVALIVFAYLVNISGNRSIGAFALVMSAMKIGGILLFGIAALAVGGFTFAPATGSTELAGIGSFIASVALAILAFKGFTTITNSGAEIVDPSRNVGRAIMISIAVCIVAYLLVAFAVGSNLTLDQIIIARDYSLAEAAKPALGNYGFYFTVILAVVATASGLIASVFAVSRMLTMLTEMKMIPHRHFGMSGPIREHMLVYTVVIAGALTVLFDLGRIASLGAFFYLVMDILIHWGVLRRLRNRIGAAVWVMIGALSFDLAVLAAFAAIKLRSDPMIVLYAVLGILAVFLYERVYLSRWAV